LFLLLVVYLGATAGYVSVRDRKVPAEQRILSERSLQGLTQRLGRLQLRRRSKSAEEDAPRIPVRFIGRGAGGEDEEEDAGQVTKAQGSKGYRAALQMVQEAIRKQVTDIHLEPTREEMTVRFRIDGILQPSDPFSRSLGDAVINIFKVLSDMDITEKRK